MFPIASILQTAWTCITPSIMRNALRSIDFEADAQDMSGVIASDRYDTVLFLEVLEHVPNPFKVVAELFRILRSGGKVILSVPHLSRLHEEPYDFYRYTKYGLRHLFEEAGFKDIQIIPRGGFLDGVDLRDVRVVEGRQDLGFPLEPGEAIGVRGKGVGKDLQGDIAVELRVVSSPNCAHAPEPRRETTS